MICDVGDSAQDPACREQRASEDGEKHHDDQEGAEYAALLTSSLEVAPSPPQHGNVTYAGAWATMRG